MAVATNSEATLAEAVEAFRSTPFQQRPDEPTPEGYYGALLTGHGPAHQAAIHKRDAYYRDLFRFLDVDPTGLDVLEAGSGFGVGLIAVACLAARSVTGVEIVDWQAEWARACLRALNGLGDRVTVLTGSASAMPIPDSSMDVVLSLEAISHYLDYPAFLTETYRVLRPAGHLLVSDGNNGRNPRISRHCEEIWASHETDPRTTDTRPDDSGDYDPWQLVAHRRRIILDAQPGISDDDSWTLALETSGMVRGEIEAAAAQFVTTGETPGRRYQRGTLSVHPGHEMVLERLFDPYELGREIGRLGFRVKVRGHWVDSTRGPLFGAANRLLAAGGPLTIRTARAFRIAAQKC